MSLIPLPEKGDRLGWALLMLPLAIKQQAAIQASKYRLELTAPMFKAMPYSSAMAMLRRAATLGYLTEHGSGHNRVRRVFHFRQDLHDYFMAKAEQQEVQEHAETV
ncbi:MAG: hypothetical protein RR574_19515 [Comamonas sp.]